MDPLSLIQNIASLSVAIYERSQLIKSNKDDWMGLVSRVQDITASLKGLSDIPESEQFIRSLNALNRCLQDCHQFIDKLSKQEENLLGKMKQVLKADKYSARLASLNNQLDRFNAQLTLAITAHLLVKREKDHATQLRQTKALEEALKEKAVLRERETTRQVALMNERALKERRDLIEELQNARYQAALRSALLKEQEAANHERAPIAPIVQKQLESIMHRLDEMQAMHLAGLISSIGVSEAKAPETDDPLFLEAITPPLKEDYNDLSLIELQFTEFLAHGQWGDIYKGFYENDVVAIKLLEMMTEENLYQFKTEMRSLSALSTHPAIIDFKGACLEPHRGAAVFEYVGGGTLQSALESTTLSLPSKEAIIQHLASGLLHLHQQNIVHGDITLKNVLLTEKGDAKWGSFGFAKLLSEKSHRHKSEVSTDLTFMAPEYKERGRDALTQKADVYSFGLLLWCLLTDNKIPFVDETAFEANRDKIPTPYHSVIEACLATNPDDRPRTETLIQDLLYAESQCQEKRSDFAKAKRGYETLSKEGYARALTSLGLFAARGIEEPDNKKDARKAKHLYEEAAEKGHVRAMYNLGVLLQKGDHSVASDKRAAAHWFQEVLKRVPDDEGAKAKLAECEGARLK